VGTTKGGKKLKVRLAKEKNEGCEGGGETGSGKKRNRTTTMHMHCTKKNGWGKEKKSSNRRAAGRNLGGNVFDETDKKKKTDDRERPRNPRVIKKKGDGRRGRLVEKKKKAQSQIGGVVRGEEKNAQKCDGGCPEKRVQLFIVG